MLLWSIVMPFMRTIAKERVMNQKLKAILVCTFLFSSANAYAACVGSTEPGGPCATVPDRSLPTPGRGVSAVQGGDISTGTGSDKPAAAGARAAASNECGCSFLMTPTGVILIRAESELKR